jgi:hypothetical protein
MYRLWTVLVCLASIYSAAAATPETYVKPPFPRHAVDWISNQNYEQAAIQLQIAAGNIALIQVWPNWEAGRGTTLNKVIRSIKNRNPSELIFQYINNNEIVGTAASNGVFSDLFKKLSAMRWYLYSSGTNGSPVPSAWQGASEINNTPFTHVDSGGDNWVTWYAKWAYKSYYVPNPLLDGFVTDNVFLKPRVDGDWDLDGSSEQKNDPKSSLWLQQGYVQHFATLDALMPGKFQIGNVAEWGASNANLQLYRGMLNGGVMEALIGRSWSVETWGGWQTMMGWISNTMAALGEPKLGVFSQVGDATDYRAFRYGFASCLMTDAYYAFNSLAGGNGDDPWFDEYAWQGKLGMSTTATPTAAWQKGVYRRDYQHGIVLVNPKNNGIQTITLETDYRRLSSTCPSCKNQAPNVNSGELVRTLTLDDRDGIVLLRIEPQTPSSHVN